MAVMLFWQRRRFISIQPTVWMLAMWLAWLARPLGRIAVAAPWRVAGLTSRLDATLQAMLGSQRAHLSACTGTTARETMGQVILMMM